MKHKISNIDDFINENKNANGYKVKLSVGGHTVVNKSAKN
jgi:hypothetical protein